MGRRTALLDPVSGRPISRRWRYAFEDGAFAEKFQAALSRREAAIRDFTISITRCAG